MSFEQVKACNMSGEKLQNLSKLSLLLKSGIYLFSFIFVVYAMTCVLFVIHILSVYNALLGCLHRLQNKENCSEPPKHRRLKGVWFTIKEYLLTLSGMCV